LNEQADGKTRQQEHDNSFHSILRFEE